MVTREDAVRRLEHLAREIQDLSKAIEEAWKDPSEGDDTQAFLEKCGGWQDTRTPDQIVHDVYASRTASDRGAATFA